MKSFLIFLHTIIIYSGLTSEVVGHAKLTALNNSVHSVQLYRSIQNEDEPFESDLSHTDAQVRYRLCEDIRLSGYFRENNLLPIDTFYCDTQNLMKRQRCTIAGLFTFEDYLFVCAFPNSSNIANPYYISKEYNVGPFGDELYKPGRFVFGQLIPTGRNLKVFRLASLAEEPAIPYIATNLDAELQYLRIRRHTKPAKERETDPLCTLTLGARQDPRNQNIRLCVAVLTSSHFKDDFLYPDMFVADDSPCHEEEISFRTSSIRKKSYREWLTRCSPVPVDNPEESTSLYLSRAYLSNAIFVYRRDEKDGKMYIENMSTNISVVDEQFSFEFTEK